MPGAELVRRCGFLEWYAVYWLYWYKGTNTDAEDTARVPRNAREAILLEKAAGLFTGYIDAIYI